MKLINLFGGPGSGKTTLAAGLFAMMKQAGFKVEYEPEWVKRYTYKDTEDWPSQYEILKEQAARIHEKVDHVDWLITDSPLLMQKAYIHPSQTKLEGLIKDASEEIPREDQFNVYVLRVKPYAAYGRSQSESEAMALGFKIQDMCKPFDYKLPGDSSAPMKVLLQGVRHFSHETTKSVSERDRVAYEAALKHLG